MNNTKEYFGIHLMVPGTCKATCPFCYTKEFKSKDKDLFLKKLINRLDKILSTKPKEKFDVHLLFTGKENTMDLVYLDKLMKSLDDYKIKEKITGHIVLPTNGYDILNAIPIIKNVVNRVGVSLNSINYTERKSIYNINLSDEYYSNISKALSDNNLLSAVSIVINDTNELNSLKDYIYYVNKIGFKHLRFRLNSFDTFEFDKFKLEILSNIAQSYTNDCTNTVHLSMDNGMRVDLVYRLIQSNNHECVIFDDGVYKDFDKKEKLYD